MSRSWQTLRVTAKTAEAQDITSFELADPEGQMLPGFSAGSHIDVEVAPGLVRQYSLCNDPREQHRYLICVLREPRSRGGSIAISDTVQVGTLIRVSEPRNQLGLDPSASRVLLFAGGIGVTPILCMAERLAHTSIPFEMHYCARSRSRAAFYQRIRVSSFRDKVAFHFDDEPQSKLDLISTLQAHAPGDHLYVCGPKGFIDVVLQLAEAAGWPPERLHREYFTPADDLVQDGGGRFQVELASSGVRYEIPADRSVVDILLANGVNVPVSCEQGVCGTCLTRLLQGVPDHRDMFMTDAEHSRNDQFTPCCSRAKSDLLVLDL
jgi:vanillate O-demethylase ferredoxin subunit